MCMSSTCPNNKSGIGADFLCNCKPGQVNEKKYYDMGGNEISLYQLIKKEPAWAASRIRVGDYACKMLKRILNSNSELFNESDERFINANK